MKKLTNEFHKIWFKILKSKSEISSKIIKSQFKIWFQFFLTLLFENFFFNLQNLYKKNFFLLIFLDFLKKILLQKRWKKCENKILVKNIFSFHEKNWKTFGILMSKKRKKKKNTIFGRQIETLRADFNWFAFEDDFYLFFFFIPF